MQRLTGRVSEAHIHESGPAQIVRNGNQSSRLGFDGALSFLIMLRESLHNQLYHYSNEQIIYSSDIWNAVINKEDATVDFINERQSPYFAQLRTLL